MNDKIKTWLPVIVVAFAFVTTIVIIVIQNHRIKELEDLPAKAIRLEKESLMTLDSLQGLREEAFLDSMHSVIGKLEVKDKSLTEFNRLIKIQNEKLDKLYRSVPVDRPEF